jgi:hypothetical protein
MAPVGCTGIGPTEDVMPISGGEVIDKVDSE